jgi:hypothetical protein
MGILIVMSPRGHDEFAFDNANRLEVEEIERRFNELIGQGFIPTEAKLGADGKPTGEHNRIRQFDPEAEQTVMMPHLVGG